MYGLEKKTLISLLVVILLAASATQSRAEEGPLKSIEEIPAKAKAKKKEKAPPKGRVQREKEAEGTEAADRFEADTVIKSRYKLNGESLEVDPD